MIRFSPRADRHVDQLIAHYKRPNRYEAITQLDPALEEASTQILRNPTGGLPAPRPYPQFARPGRAWVKAGRYWIACRRRPHLVIAAVLYDTANIPNRL